MYAGPVGTHGPRPALHPTIPLLACLLILLVAACGGTVDTEPAEAGAESLPPSEMTFDGTWTGATSQGELLQFTVVGNAIEQFTVSFTSAGCEADSPFSVAYGEPQIFVSEEGFSFVERSLHQFTVDGAFGPDATASGSVQIALTGPCESLDLTWEATLGGSAPEIELAEGTIPDLEIPDHLFDPEAEASNFDESGTQVLASQGDWYYVRTTMESSLPLPSGWQTEETGKETYISFSEGRDPSDPSIFARLGFDGFEGDERTSDELLAEFKRTVEGEPALSVKRERIVDDTRAWTFLEATTESGNTRYLLNLFSKDAQRGFFYDLYVFTDEEDWRAYYPLVVAMVDGWRGLDGAPLGMPLPDSLAD
jgi:hypothetical protein